MKHIKYCFYVLFIACIISGSLLIAASCIKEKQPPVTKEPVIKGLDVDQDMKDSIFKLIAEGPNEAFYRLVSLDENGVQVYSWQDIGGLLQKKPEDMKVEDYVAALQVIHGMTQGNSVDTVKTDYKTMELFVQRGYDAGGLSLTMANICALYKEWVEDILVATQSHILSVTLLTEEAIILQEYLKEEMLKATILNGFLTNDTTYIPEIRIQPQAGGSEFYTIWIGDQLVMVNPFYSSRAFYKSFSHMRDNIILFAQSETQLIDKVEESVQLEHLATAYAMGGVLSVSKDCDIQMLICFNDAELEIRVHAFSMYMYEINHETKGDPKYLSVTVLELKSQLNEDMPTELMNEYIKWWHNSTAQDYYNDYRQRLEFIYFNYRKNTYKYSEINFSQLTQTQIIELEKKRKDDNYPLDLGDAP
jgi:hypothetical protein